MNTPWKIIIRGRNNYEWNPGNMLWLNKLFAASNDHKTRVQVYVKTRRMIQSGRPDAMCLLWCNYYKIVFFFYVFACFDFITRINGMVAFQYIGTSLLRTHNIDVWRHGCDDLITTPQQVDSKRYALCDRNKGNCIIVIMVTRINYLQRRQIFVYHRPLLQICIFSS